MKSIFLTPASDQKSAAGWNLDHPWRSLRREMDRLFDAPASAVSGEGWGTFAPMRLNVSESEAEYKVTAELPGVGPEDVEVTLSDGRLVIKGEKKFEKEDKKAEYLHVECAYGSFQRVVDLPLPIDEEKVQAKFENGVLCLTLPKAAEADKTRKIQIKAA